MARPKSHPTPTHKASKPPAVVARPATVAQRSTVMVSNPYSLASFIAFFSNNFVLVFLAGLFFIGGFVAGSFWTENQFLKSGSGTQVVQGNPSVVDPNAVGPTGPTAEQLKAVPKVSNDDRIKGNKNAKIVLIEYSDFECPYCARFHPTIAQVAKEYGDQVAWVYRDYPLPFHPNAQKAAEAARCVSKQKGNDGFWTYGDKLFEENTVLGGKLTPEVISSVAQGMGVNMDAFKKCLDSGEMADEVKAQMDAGAQAGVNGTPGTFIVTKDGAQELIPGALPVEQVKASIEKYL